VANCACCSRVAHLKCKAKALKAKVLAFETGERYIVVHEDARRQLAVKDRQAKKLKHDVTDAERRIVDMRKNWMQVYDDIQKRARTQAARLPARGCGLRAAGAAR
jgi:cell division protein FtsB